MIEYAPYVMGLAGATILVTVATVRTNGAVAFVFHKLLCGAIGAGAVWMSAVMLAGGA